MPETAQANVHNGRLFRLILVLGIASVPLVQLIAIELASADHQICFGSEGGWRKPRDLLHLLHVAAQSLNVSGMLFGLVVYAMPVLPIIIYIALPAKPPSGIKAIMVGIYVIVTIAPFLGPPRTYHDCDSKGLDLLGVLPPILSLAATLGFLALVGAISVHQNFHKKDT